MFKRNIKETTEYYDENGKLTKREIKEEHSEDDTVYKPSPTLVPWNTYSNNINAIPCVKTTTTNSEV